MPDTKPQDFPKSIAEEYFQKFTGPTGLSAIQELPGEKMLEDNWIDFKAGGKMQDKNQRRTILSEVAGSFANTEGGVVIWGVDARKENGIDAVQRLDPIDDILKFASDLAEEYRMSLDPPLGPIKIEPVPIVAGESKGYVVCFFPAGKDQPYESVNAGGHFYMRSGGTKQRIPRAMLRRMFFPSKVSRPRLKITFKHEGSKVYMFALKLSNEGAFTIERGMIKITADFPSLVDPQAIPNDQTIMPLGVYIHPSFTADGSLRIIDNRDTFEPVFHIVATLYQRDYRAMELKFRFRTRYKEFLLPDGTASYEELLAFFYTPD